MATAKRPRVTVLDRRLQNPFGEPSSPVQFKEAGRVPRWFNSAIIADKIWRAKHKGWHLTYEADIVDLDQIGGYGLSPAGNHIVRGERGQEVLMWMLADEYDQIQWAKTAVNTRNMGNPDAMRRELSQATGDKYGPEAAQFINRTGPVGGVVDTFERIERKPEQT